MAFFESSQHMLVACRVQKINMIPLIDVMLVLLVIFMVTAPLLTHAVKLELPRANSHQVKASEKKSKSPLTQKNKQFSGMAELIASEALTERLRQLAQDGP